MDNQDSDSITGKIPDVSGKAADYPSMTLRLAVTDCLIAAILIAAAIVFGISSSNSRKLVEQQEAVAGIENLLRDQGNAAFETHLAAGKLMDEWAYSPKDVRASLLENLKLVSEDFDNKAEKLLANSDLTSIGEFENGDAAVRQLSDLAHEIIAFHANENGEVMRENITSELVGNHRFLFSLINDVEEVVHRQIIVTQAKIAQKSADMSRIISIGAIMVITSLALRFALTLRWVVRPAHKLARVTKELSEGDIHQEIPQMYVSELHQISEALEVFRDMTIETDELRKRSFESQKRAHRAHLELERRTRGSEELMQQERRKTITAMGEKFETSITAIVDGVGKAAQQIAVSADQLSREANAAVEQANKIADDSTNVARNVEHVASSVVSFSSSVGKIAEQVEDAGELSQAMRDATVTRDGVTKILGEKAVGIDSRMAAIVDAANQTNAMVLKLVLDAAPVNNADGQYTAMADKIKEMARQTNVSAAEMSKLINSMDGDLTGAREAGKCLTASLVQVREVGEKIRAALGDQKMVAGEIKDNAAEAAARTQHVSQNISNLAVGAQRANKLAANMKNAADDLDEQALELERAAVQFAKLMRAA